MSEVKYPMKCLQDLVGAHESGLPLPEATESARTARARRRGASAVAAACRLEDNTMQIAKVIGERFDEKTQLRHLQVG